MPEEEKIDAYEAARRALDLALVCIRERKSFLMEAGAGSGKTHTLTQVLAQIVADEGTRLLQEGKRIACITYTNVASDQIALRIDNHPAVLTSTIHAFCWEMIGGFQAELRRSVLLLPKVLAKIEEAGGLAERRVVYDLGHRSVRAESIHLHHDDVLALFVMLLANGKFRSILQSRFPYILIDEYQDTDADLAAELQRRFWDTGGGPVFALFGDHWQKIYGTGCGKVESQGLTFIPKHSNFRSVGAIVESLNRIRTELPQEVADPEKVGTVTVFHTNGWNGPRETRNPWQGDLPQASAHSYLVAVKACLGRAGWDFSSRDSKILMLTHRVLASEMGYQALLGVFDYNDSLTKKQDPHIEFFLETVEPAIRAYETGRYGEAMKFFSGKRSSIRTRADKELWRSAMAALGDARRDGTVEDVLRSLRSHRVFHVPDRLVTLAADLDRLGAEEIAASSSHRHLRNLFAVSYSEVSSFFEFEQSYTPFATKHGVKGEGHENVLVVFGRGWNLYDFNRLLEHDRRRLSAAEQATFERNRNLFYVVCSRAKTNMALLFTQQLSPAALSTLERWFGRENVGDAPTT